jgi:hypothetical protein
LEKRTIQTLYREGLQTNEEAILLDSMVVKEKLTMYPQLDLEGEQGRKWVALCEMVALNVKVHWTLN